MSLPRPYPPATYDGDGEVSAWMHRPGGEPDIAFTNGVTCEYSRPAAGRFGLYRWTFGEEGGARPVFPGPLGNRRFHDEAS